MTSLAVTTCLPYFLLHWKDKHSEKDWIVSFDNFIFGSSFLKTYRLLLESSSSLFLNLCQDPVSTADFNEPLTFFSSFKKKMSGIEWKYILHFKVRYTLASNKKYPAITLCDFSSRAVKKNLSLYVHYTSNWRFVTPDPGTPDNFPRWHLIIGKFRWCTAAPRSIPSIPKPHWISLYYCKLLSRARLYNRAGNGKSLESLKPPRLFTHYMLPGGVCKLLSCVGSLTSFLFLRHYRVYGGLEAMFSQLWSVKKVFLLRYFYDPLSPVSFFFAPFIID